MEKIYDTNDTFKFDNLILTKPVLIAGGNYFIRCLINNKPLYIQPPKCTTKQGILIAGKRFYTDLMFTNENENFIRWMENLENHCQKYIFNNRTKWFDGEMELHDIENYFTSPLKLFKSGKYYIARTNVASALGKPTLKIYDENEQEISYETLTDKMNVMTILEIQGIKCSAKSFQIEIEVKQIMVLKPADLFEKCVIKTTTVAVSNSQSIANVEKEKEKEPILEKMPIVNIESSNAVEEYKPIIEEPTYIAEEYKPFIDEDLNKIILSNEVTQQTSVTQSNDIIIETELLNTVKKSNNDLEEFEFHLDELPETDTIQLKNRNDVYYEMYRNARKKARTARKMALAAYLEAKHIKNTYMLDDVSDSDSDNDTDDTDDDSHDDTDESNDNHDNENN